jgi:hypothetical protein
MGPDHKLISRRCSPHGCGAAGNDATAGTGRPCGPGRIRPHHGVHGHRLRPRSLGDRHDGAGCHGHRAACPGGCRLRAGRPGHRRVRALPAGTFQRCPHESGDHPRPVRGRVRAGPAGSALPGCPGGRLDRRRHDHPALLGTRGVRAACSMGGRATGTGLDRHARSSRRGGDPGGHRGDDVLGCGPSPRLAPGLDRGWPVRAARSGPGNVHRRLRQPRTAAGPRPFLRRGPSAGRLLDRPGGRRGAGRLDCSWSPGRPPAPRPRESPHGRPAIRAGG